MLQQNDTKQRVTGRLFGGTLFYDNGCGCSLRGELITKMAAVLKL